MVGAPKKQLEPAERLWIQLEKESKDTKRKAGKKLGNRLTKLYKENKLPASDVSDLLQAADEAGLEFANPIPKKRKFFEPGKATELGEASEPEEGCRDKNAARSLDRFLRKNHTWKDLYWAKIPMKNPKKKSNDMEEKWMPFLLPHEWLPDYLLQSSAWQEGMPEEGSFLASRLAKACESYGEPRGNMFPLGLHGDGVPVQGRMNQSTLDFWTVNLVGSKRFNQMRVPICALDARMIGWQTIEQIGHIMLWSFQCLAEGKFPRARHDGSNWMKSDKNRQVCAGHAMPGKAALVQIRSDWDWNCKYFHAPQWNEKKGMCWLCRAKPENWREMTTCPAWERQEQSLDKAEYLHLLAERDKEANPLFTLPSVSNDTMMPDWMHVLDEGTGALAAGQILKELLSFYPGAHVDERVSQLWEHIQALYEEQHWPKDKRLKKLTLKDIVKPKKVPELDGKAHEVRHFCPLLECLCKAKGLDEGNVHHRAVYKVAKYCSKMYKCLEEGNLSELEKAGRKFVSQYMALEVEATSVDESEVKLWRSKPKFHLTSHILDLVALGHNPKDSWNYRDETFAGFMQKLSFRRGGRFEPGMAAEKILLRWMADTPFSHLQQPSSSSRSL